MQYEVKSTSTGYVITKENKELPLPYSFISKQHADKICRELNEYGPIAECCYRLVQNYKNFEK